ncbi:hypothetical protein VTJ49DRAFT_3999 [Mycothermus thermophilus]|uniref:SRP9 domain-containing protein n=1 Tax=Humicola insolens TaxID=85995 RepID=A0ABR3VLV7_HUMIN
MPYYAKSEDWLHQSALLLQARPTTTRITTRYHLKPARRVRKARARKQTDDTTSQPPSQDQQQQAQEQQIPDKPPRGHLVLKTFDPASGVTLKYKTSKAAEVSRLVQMLGTLGRRMAGVPDLPAPSIVTLAAEEGVGAGAGAVEGGDGEAGGVGMSRSASGVGTPTPGGSGAGAGQQAAAAGGGGGGGGKGKKKKGKR